MIRSLKLLAGIAVTVLATTSTLTQAQDYPTRSVRMVLPPPAGNGSTMRTLRGG